jgi:DUF438 domain-containing protein
MLENLTKEQLEAILDTLPLEFIFVDDQERLQYANKGDKRSRPSPPNLMGNDVRACHQKESLPMFEQFVNNLKTGKKDEENFWILMPDRKILNRFLAVRDKSGKYLGMVEYLLDFKAMEELKESKKDAHKRDYAAPTTTLK